MAGFHQREIRRTFQTVKLLIGIDKANAEIKPLLSELNVYKAQKSFLSGLNDYIAKSLRKYYYSETNKTAYYELNFKQEEILALIAQLSEKIENLEEKIQKLNFETQVLAEQRYSPGESEKVNSVL